ncbi:hypothetical protein [Streptomyces flavidovirens]|uniref:hypothetical protein n=1 Tax=Streptomyces flavidovirens TaxID=67298 RepID=UPI000407A55E
MTGIRTLRTALPAAALVAALAATGCTPEGAGGSSGGQASGSAGSALAAVEELTVKGRAPKTGYEREAFGSAWADTDENGCGTRVISTLRAVTGMFSQCMQGVVSCA